MDDPKKFILFLKEEIEEYGLVFIKESLKNSNFTEISFYGKYLKKIKIR
jgi:hypothetical protein